MASQVTHKEVFAFFIKDFLENAEGAEYDIAKSKISNLGDSAIDVLYEKYLGSNEILVTYDHLADVIENICSL